MEFAEYLAQIDTPGDNRYDVSRLFLNPEVRRSFVADLSAPFDADEVDFVAGIDALGFLPGVGVADVLDAGFLPVRKGGKLPVADAVRLSETVTDYTGEEKTLEVDRSALPDGAHVLVVDDWVETGAQMTAATRLVERAGGEAAGVAALDAEVNDRSRALTERYRFHAVNPETHP